MAGTVTPKAGKFSAVHAEPLAPRPRTVRQGHSDTHAAGPAGDALERSAVPRSAGERPERVRRMPRVEDRHDPGRLWSGLAPIRNRRQRVFDWPVRGAPFGLSHRHARRRGPIQPRVWSWCERGSTSIRKTRTLTITTDETGPYAIPQIVFGVPLRLQRMTVDIDRPGLHVQPDQLRRAADHGVGLRQSGRDRDACRARSPSAVARASRSNRSSPPRTSGQHQSHARARVST